MQLLLHTCGSLEFWFVNSGMLFLKAIQGRKVLDLFISLFCIFLCWCSCLKQCSTQMRPQHYLCNDE